MDKTATLASDILLGIGGEQNILRLENCMTRVRVEVKDDAVLDIPRLKQLHLAVPVSAQDHLQGCG